VIYKKARRWREGLESSKTRLPTGQVHCGAGEIETWTVALLRDSTSFDFLAWRDICSICLMNRPRLTRMLQMCEESGTSRITPTMSYGNC
jgi:hypothetical protein